MEYVYSKTEVDEFLATNPTVRVKIREGTAKRFCSCGCGGALSIGSHAANWFWIRGHKPGAVDEGHRGSSIPKSDHSLIERYKSTLGLIEIDIAVKESTMKEISDRTIKLMKEMNDLDAEVVKLKASAAALKTLTGEGEKKIVQV